MARNGGIFWTLVGLLALLNAGWWLWLEASPVHTEVQNYAFNLVYGLAYLVAGVFLASTAWRWRKSTCPDGISVASFGLHLLFYAVGQGLWAYANLAMGSDIPSPWLPDLFYGASAILQIIGFLFLLLHPHRTQRIPTPVTAALIGGAVTFSFLVAWLLLFALKPGDHALFELDQFYISAAIVSAFFALICIQRERHVELRQFLVVLLSAVLVSGFASVLYGIRVASGLYWNGDVADAMFMLSGLLYLVACFRLPTTLREHKRQEDGNHGGTRERLEILLPAGIVALGIVVAAAGAEAIYVNWLADARAQAQFEAVQLSQSIHQSVSEDLTRLSALGGFVNGSQVVEAAEFQAFAESLPAQTGSRSHLALFGADGSLRFVDTDGRTAFDLDVVVRISANARTSGDIVVSEPMLLPSGEPGIIASQSVFRGQEFLGTSVVSIPLSHVFELTVIPPGSVETGTYHVFTAGRVLSLGDVRLYDREGREVVNADGAISPDVRLDSERTFVPESAASTLRVGDQIWTVRVAPGRSALRTTYLLAIGLFFGILLIFVSLAGIVHLIVGQRTQLRLEIERKSRVLNQFVSLVAHQLRAPMTQLRWMSGHLASHARLPKDAREIADQIETISERESKLVSDLLNVSRIERGVLKIELENMSLSSLATEVAEPLAMRAAERGVALVFDKSLARTTVRADRQKAVEALRNVLDNAISYSPEGGSVRMYVSETNRTEVVLAIADLGSGIPEDIRPTLFDIRLTAKESEPGAGPAPTSTGLGLYLTKQFLLAMGASVSYKTGTGGTTFFVRFPRAPGRRIAPARSKR